MTIEQLAKEKNRTVKYVIKKLQKEGFLRIKNDTANPKAQTANKQLSDNAQICDDGTIIWDGRSELGKTISNLIKVQSNKKRTTSQNEGHNFDTFEEFCDACDDMNAQLFESQGAKSQKYFYEKYSELEKEKLEEELDLAYDERDENKITVLKNLLDAKKVSSSEIPAIFSKWWEEALSDAQKITDDDGYDFTE